MESFQFLDVEKKQPGASSSQAQGGAACVMTSGREKRLMFYRFLTFFSDLSAAVITVAASATTAEGFSSHDSNQKAQLLSHDQVEP